MPSYRRTASKGRRGRHNQGDAGGPKLPRLRIIGGLWRSRQLTFPQIEGLRPTPDRVRETLFNWLAAEIPGSRCLDLFAGSGALGLEALSREAREVVFVDRSPVAAQTLRDNLRTLGSDRGRVKNVDALQFLAAAEGPFDVIFLDPPFRHDWLATILSRLAKGNWFKDRTWIYVEHEAGLASLTVPHNWTEYRRKEAGQVVYRLFQVVGTQGEA